MFIVIELHKMNIVFLLKLIGFDIPILIYSTLNALIHPQVNYHGIV